MIPAAFLDPAGNGIDLADIATLVGILAAIAGVLAGVIRWNAARVAKVRTAERVEMEDRIKSAVTEATAQIQPKNGGKGWQDVHSKLDTVIDRQAEVVDDVRYLRGRLDSHIDGHHHEGT
jgi:hypothetical protein